MVSVIYMFLGCCAASVPVSDAWWWQLPILDRLRQGRPVTPWDDSRDIPAYVPDNPDKLKLLLMGLPKRGLTLLSNRENGSMSRIIKGRISPFRRIPVVGRPRGHPLRWG